MVKAISSPDRSRHARGWDEKTPGDGNGKSFRGPPTKRNRGFPSDNDDDCSIIPSFQLFDLSPGLWGKEQQLNIMIMYGILGSLFSYEPVSCGGDRVRFEDLWLIIWVWFII